MLAMIFSIHPENFKALKYNTHDFKFEGSFAILFFLFLREKKKFERRDHQNSCKII